VKILIACIGNIFLGDDGFGPEAARALAAAQLPQGVKLVDFGIRGLDLSYSLLESWDAVILVDVVSRGGVPGTLYLLQPGAIPEAAAGLDPHALDPVSVLAGARSLGEITAEIYIAGCEPLDFGDELEGRMGLSPQVAAALPEMTKMVKELVGRLEEKELQTQGGITCCVANVKEERWEPLELHCS
jgi:hydrogenase maturation protease